MIKAQKNRIISNLFAVYHKRLLRKHFYQIYLTGEEHFQKIDITMPTILYANHSNWWDGFIAFELTSKYLGVDDYLMMDIEQMKKYRFFKYVGVFSVNRNDVREGVESINYAAELLKNSSKYLWLFPQGLMQVQDYEPIKFYSGVTRIAEKLGKVNLVPVSFRYEYIMEQRTEVFIKIGNPDIINNNISDIKNYTQYLQGKLVNDLSELKSDVINQNLSDYKIIFTGKHSRNKTVDKLYE
jgi:chlorobactene lauroyltransferase